MNGITFSRKQLYDLVWSNSLVSLAKVYNISDNGLRKACKRMEIPLPDIGHWNKVKAGKKVIIKPFLDKVVGQQQLILSLRNEGENATKDRLSPQLTLQRLIEADESIDLVIKKQLSSPDPLVKQAQHAFLSESEVFVLGDLRSTRSGSLEISVSPDLVERSLRIMDVFIKAMRQRGHDFFCEDGYYKVSVSGEAIGMALKERQNVIIAKDRLHSRTYKANGHLTFKFEQSFLSTVCQDGKKQKIEQQLPKLISRLELMAQRLRRKREENERMVARIKEEERIRKQRDERKKLEIRSFRQLAKDASRWKEAQIIREYLNQREHDALDENIMTEEMTAWLEWARKKVDWYDPMVGANDEWLNDTNPNMIMREDDTHRMSNHWPNQRDSDW